ncbi:MAG: hypothetical protein IT455_06775 [Planctomycetes bacterium]|nr:hypothetical protein [Planctomycetota bacterium]
MQFESHATPSQETPEQRYASLHRAIERGLAADEVWKELAEVSLRLGHSDEAIRCLRHIRSDTVRGLLESRLRRLGLIEAAPRPPAAAPAASHAGPPAETNGEDEGKPSLPDHLADAFQYLFHQHMPWLVLVTTLAFPLVIGVGGFLTAGQSPWMLAAIAALPGLCVLAVVGAMGRQILHASSEGNGDVPPVPGFADLVDDARRFLVDAGLVFVSLFLPSLLAMHLGAPAATTMPGLVIGALLAPMVWTLRQLRGDLRALSPILMVRAIARGGVGYFGLAVTACLLFAPAAGVTMLVVDRPVWVQIAVIGPLCVVPLFVVSRLFGTWVDARRGQLANLLLLTRRKAAVRAEDVAAPDLSQPRFPRRPESLQNFQAPTAKKRLGNAPPAKAATAPSSPASAPAASPAPQAATAKARPRAPAAAAPAAAAPTAAKPAKPAPRAIEGRSPQPRLTDAPDLAHMPGAVVLSGSERERLAAAKKP